MKASLRALLSGVIDYAGLFPPAQLPLEEAIRNYQDYRASADEWMLGRFVCPAVKLKDLNFVPPLTVVGRGGTDFLTAVQQDVADMTALRERRYYAVIDGYEVRIGTELLRPRVEGRLSPSSRFPDLHSFVATFTFRATSFFELEQGPAWAESVGALLSEIASTAALLSEIAITSDRRTGLKVRCGGATATAVPSTSLVAHALAACRTAGVPLKFTAGLHHPLRHYDSSLATMTHGFLNVFVAGALCHARGLDAAAIQPILEDEDPKSFRFEDDRLQWKEFQATTDEVVAARKDFVISFGSCSFDEPPEDLRALGLME
jgi:hypothetical protein